MKSKCNDIIISWFLKGKSIKNHYKSWIYNKEFPVQLIKYEDLEKNPEKLYKLSARGMLPKTKLGAKMIKKLKIYAGAELPHTAQLAK